MDKQKINLNSQLHAACFLATIYDDLQVDPPENIREDHILRLGLLLKETVTIDHERRVSQGLDRLIADLQSHKVHKVPEPVYQVIWEPWWKRLYYAITYRMGWH
jgi:hypothetical protein